MEAGLDDMVPTSAELPGRTRWATQRWLFAVVGFVLIMAAWFIISVL